MPKQRFLRCVGLEFAVNQCANKVRLSSAMSGIVHNFSLTLQFLQILGCAQRGAEAFECLGGIVCAGKSLRNCAR